MDDEKKAIEEFDREERDVEQRSSVFKRELGLTDLILTQVLFIVGLPWVGVAAKQGSSHVVLWLVAMLLFYLPSAVIVIYLNRIMPLEGGLYQWAKLGFNELLGFLVGWNLWLFAILNTSEIGLQVTQYLGYIFGPRAEHLTSSAIFTCIVNVVIVGLLVMVTIKGLSLGKWVHKTGGVLMILTFGALLVIPLFHSGISSHLSTFKFEMPVLSLMSLNLLGKMGFGALGGFEYVAIHAGECRDPVRTIGRSVMIAAPLIGLMFILGTQSVLMLVPANQIDLIAPIPQVLSEGFRSISLLAPLASLTIVALLSIRVAQASVMFGGNTRLPMVAGWDHLLPGWFTRLHPRFRTPVNSIVFVGLSTLALGIAGLAGVGRQEAFQLLWNASGVFYALTYLVMFAVPIVGLKGHLPRPPLWLKVCAISGFLMTLLFIALSIVPIVEVANRWVFAVKITALIVVTNLVALAIFRFFGRGRKTN